MFPINGLSNEALGVLRNCILSQTITGDDGTQFVRCGYKLGIETAYRLAAEIRDKLGDKEPHVVASWNGETGHEDYVRVSRGSTAFRLICHMKS